MFEHKDYVSMIFKEKNFGKAAEKLHVSQPALSAMIKRLEKELGAPLFNRKTTPISLTPFGSAYLKSADIVTQLENQLKNRALEENSLLSGDLTICAFSLSLPYWTTKKIAAFHQKYPGIRLRLQNHNTLQAKMTVDAYQGDLLLSTKNMSPEKYIGLPLYHEQLVLAIPRKFPINRQFAAAQLTPFHLQEQLLREDSPAVSLKDFASAPFVLASKENYIRECADALFQEARIHPSIAIETASSSVALNFARLGCAAAICSHLLLTDGGWDSQLCLYKLNSRLARRTGYLYYRKGAYVTPAMEKFMAEMQA